MEKSLQSKKKLKISKNRKKGWKKTDITEVEDFLEDERLQERTGGLVAEKTDEQLFVVEKLPEVELSLQKKRKKRDVKNLKCHSNLILDPQIKPARIAHNLRQQTLNKRHIAVVEKVKSGKKTKTELQADSQRKKDNLQKRQKTRSEHRLFQTQFDLWGTDDPTEDNDIPFKKKRVNPPKHYGLKPSEIRNVELPHPGSSYNPALDDYQELIQKAHNVEVKKERIQKKIYNSLEAKFKGLDATELQENWLQEMSAGLEDGETAEDNDTSNVDRISVNPPVHRENKKTKTQRNKEYKLKQEKKMLKKQKDKKIKDNAIFRLKSIKTEIKKEEQESAKRREERLKREAENKLKTRKLGKMKFEEPDLEVKLMDELEGSLRLLKPEGHLLEDRFKSLQKRSIIEPRQEAKNKRKYKKKVFVKRSHRTE